MLGSYSSKNLYQTSWQGSKDYEVGFGTSTSQSFYGRKLTVVDSFDTTFSHNITLIKRAF